VIAGSAVLVLLAAGLLVTALVRGTGSSLYAYLLYASIVGSAIAALAIIVGVRRLPTGPDPADDFDAPHVPLGGPGPRVDHGVDVARTRRS